MTYEPGQQVLVRGEILPPPMPAHIGLFVRFVSEDGEGRRIFVRPDDVIGPAPATPDKGASYEPGQPISDDWHRSYERLTTGKLARLYELAMKERGEARGALAVAEAERDAIAAAGRLLYVLWDTEWNKVGFADYGDHTGITWAEEQQLSDAAEAVEDYFTAHPDIRRALSVEAAGTEGGKP
jgi:hypothetical protein